MESVVLIPYQRFILNHREADKYFQCLVFL